MSLGAKGLIKPYNSVPPTKEEKIFNYRLSWARRTAENTFGILVNWFRIFAKKLACKLPTVDRIVTACCALHNWLCKERFADLPVTRLCWWRKDRYRWIYSGEMEIWGNKDTNNCETCVWLQFIWTCYKVSALHQKISRQQWGCTAMARKENLLAFQKRQILHVWFCNNNQVKCLTLKLLIVCLFF